MAEKGEVVIGEEKGLLVCRPDRFIRPWFSVPEGCYALVTRFGQDTMLLWWALLLHARLLFVGQPAGDVGSCCLACPLLAAPPATRRSSDLLIFEDQQASDFVVY